MRKQPVPTKRPLSLKTLRKIGTISISYVDRNTGDVRVVKLNPRKELLLNGRDLSEVYDEHPSQVFLWGYIKECLEAQLRKAENAYQKTYRTYYRVYRMRLNEEHHNVTEPWIKSETEDNSHVKNKKGAVDALRNQLGIANLMCLALDHRRSMLTRQSR